MVQLGIPSYGGRGYQNGSVFQIPSVFFFGAVADDQKMIPQCQHWKTLEPADCGPMCSNNHPKFETNQGPPQRTRPCISPFSNVGRMVLYFIKQFTDMEIEMITWGREKDRFFDTSLNFIKCSFHMALRNHQTLAPPGLGMRGRASRSGPTNATPLTRVSWWSALDRRGGRCVFWKLVTTQLMGDLAENNNCCWFRGSPTLDTPISESLRYPEVAIGWHHVHPIFSR